MIEFKQLRTKRDLLIALEYLNEVFSSDRHPILSKWFKKTLNDYIKGCRVLYEINFSNNKSGYVLLHYYNKTVKLNAIVIFPEFRRMGIAEKTCVKIINHLMGKDVEFLYTQIRPEYSNALKFIEKLNFIQIGSLFNIDEQKNNYLYFRNLQGTSDVNTIRETAIRIYNKSTIIWLTT